MRNAYSTVKTTNEKLSIAVNSEIVTCLQYRNRFQRHGEKVDNDERNDKSRNQLACAIADRSMFENFVQAMPPWCGLLIATVVPCKHVSSLVGGCGGLVG